MADVSYVITIKTEGGEGDSGIAKNQNGEDVGKNKKRKKEVSAKQLLVAGGGYALRLADTVITTEINRVSLRTGHSTYQQKISYHYNTGKRILTSAAMIAHGAITGNPLTALAGTASILNMGMQYAIARENLDIAKSVESVGLGMANIRAGSVIRSEGS